MDVVERFVEQANQILTGGHTADRAGQDVVEHQRGNAKLGKRAAHRFFDHAIDAAADEHAAALDVNGAHGVGKQHDAEDEPRRGFADVAFGLTTCVVRGRGQIVQHDGGGAPERDEAEERRGGYDDAGDAVAAAARGSRVGGSAAHLGVMLTLLTCELKCSHFSDAKSSGRGQLGGVAERYSSAVWDNRGRLRLSGSVSWARGRRSRSGKGR